MPSTLACVLAAPAAVLLVYAGPRFVLIWLVHRLPGAIDLHFQVFAMQAAIFLLIVVALKVPLRSLAAPSVPRPGVTAVHWLWLGGALFALLVSFTVVSTSAASGFTVADGAARLSDNFPNTGVVGGLVRLFVVAPLLEEFLFRALILGYLMRTTRPWIGLAVSVVLFAAIHNSWLVSGFLGLALGLLYLRYRSVWLCILAHAGHNLLAATAAPFLVAHLHEAGLLSPNARNLLALQLGWFAVSMACFWVFFQRLLTQGGRVDTGFLSRWGDLAAERGPP